MIFVIAQFFLGEALTGRDQALDRLRGQVTELADLLNLERKANETLRTDFSTLSDELSASVLQRDEQKIKISSLSLEVETDKNQLANVRNKLATAEAKTFINRKNLKQQLSQINTLSEDIIRLKAFQENLQQKIKASLGKLASKDETIINTDEAIYASMSGSGSVIYAVA